MEKINTEANKSQYQGPLALLKEFLPLISIIFVAILFAAFRQWHSGNISWLQAMNDFMGILLILLGLFKLIGLKGFVETYQAYDIIAKKSKIYAYAYPFIELALGTLYLLNRAPITINAITFALAVINSISVAQALSAKQEISCGCLGAVFRIPLTKITLLENVLMAAMTLAMLIMHLT